MSRLRQVSNTLARAAVAVRACLSFSQTAVPAVPAPLTSQHASPRMRRTSSSLVSESIRVPRKHGNARSTRCYTTRCRTTVARRRDGAQVGRARRRLPTYHHGGALQPRPRAIPSLFGVRAPPLSTALPFLYLYLTILAPARGSPIPLLTLSW